MGGEGWHTVEELQAAGLLLVEDGNHGEYRPRRDEFVKKGTAFVRAADMSNGRVNFLRCEHINHVALTRIRKGVGRPNDILLSHKGTVGKLALVPANAPPFVCSPQTTFWRVLDDRRLDRGYLYAFMRSRLFEAQLASVQGETDMAPYVSLTAQRRLKIALPNIRQQIDVSDLLGAMDDKIDLNRRMAETLEEMARALFRSWFVDFDPVRAKAEGRPTGLPDELSALFPDSFGEGRLPEGWAHRPLSSLGRFLNGLALQKYAPETGESSLPVIKIAELRSGPTSKSGRASARVPLDYVIKDGDHLFSWSGSLTHCRWTYGEGALNQHLFKVTPLDIPEWLTYEAVEHHLPEFQAIASGKAVTMGHIQRHHLDEALVSMPPASSLAAMDRVISPLHERSLATMLQSRTLAALRDTLLPRLISGELRVAEAEREVAAA